MLWLLSLLKLRKNFQMFVAQTFGNSSGIEMKKWRVSGLLWIIFCFGMFPPLRSETVGSVCVHSAESAWLISVILCSLTSVHWLIAYFYLFTTRKRHAVVVSVVSGWRSGPSQFILVVFFPRSWAASVKPSTLPRRLWRRNTPDVSFTKTNTNHRFKLCVFSSPQCWYP